MQEPLTICRKALESLVRLKARSGTQRGISPSMELARVRCSLASMAFSSFCASSTSTGSGERPTCCTPPHPDVGSGPDPLLTGSQDEEGFNVLLLEVGIAFTAPSWLHFIVPVQVLQRGPGDVNAAVCGDERETSAHQLRLPLTRWAPGLPGTAPRLHVVGQCHIVGPHIKLPFPQTQDPTVHTPTVDAHAHVDIHTCHLTHQSEERQGQLSFWQSLSRPTQNPFTRSRSTQPELGTNWRGCGASGDIDLRTALSSFHENELGEVKLRWKRRPHLPSGLLSLHSVILAPPSPHSPPQHSNLSIG